MTGHTHKKAGQLFGTMTFIGLSANYVLTQYEVLTTKAQILLDAKLDKVEPDITMNIGVYLSKAHWLHVINSIVFLILIRMIAKATSVLPDLDQSENTIPYKESLLARISNKTLKLIGAHHRSRHTHSIDLSIITFGLLLYGSMKYFGSQSIVTLLIVGTSVGIASHVIADMFNADGVWPTFWSRKKVAFVPRTVNGLLLGTLGLAMIVGTGILAYILKNQLGFMICIAAGLIGGTLVVLAIRCKGMRFNTGGQWEELFHTALSVVDTIMTIIAFVICLL